MEERPREQKVDIFIYLESFFFSTVTSFIPGGRERRIVCVCDLEFLRLRKKKKKKTSLPYQQGSPLILAQVNQEVPPPLSTSKMSSIRSTLSYLDFGVLIKVLSWSLIGTAAVPFF